MKKSAFPCLIDLEVKDAYGQWVVQLSYIAKNNESLYNKMEIIKSLYVLDNEYRIMLTLNSKANPPIIFKREK
jgi:hypothetical protein